MSLVPVHLMAKHHHGFVGGWARACVRVVQMEVAYHLDWLCCCELCSWGEALYHFGARAAFQVAFLLKMVDLDLLSAGSFTARTR